MLSTPRVLGAILLSLTGFNCTPQCDPVPNNPQNICHLADAGPIAPDTSFVLQGTIFLTDPVCTVTIDGGQIDLQVTGVSYCGAVGNSAAARAADRAKCTIPALPAGTYSVNSQPALTLTLPQSADAGVPTCLF